MWNNHSIKIFLDFCLSSTKRDIQYFFTVLYIHLQSIVQLVYMVPNFQYHFSHEAHFAHTKYSYEYICHSDCETFFSARRIESDN